MSYEGRCNLLNSNPVLVARHFQYKVDVFFKEIVLDCPIKMSFILNFKKEVAHMRMHSNGFSVHQILKMKLPTQSSLKKKKISAQLPDHLNDSQLFELVKTD